MSFSTIVLIILVVAAVYLVIIFNKLVALKNRFQNAFAQIEVQLKRRYDLIPNLIEVAKGYMKHESETLENVVAARNAAVSMLKAASENPGDPAAMAKLSAAEGELRSALSGLNVQVEAYPDLKANANMMQLSEELTSTENKVSFARQGYNDSATAYNIYKQSFPANFVAPIFGHVKDAGLLEFADSEAIQEAPKVQF